MQSRAFAGKLAILVCWIVSRGAPIIGISRLFLYLAALNTGMGWAGP